MKQQGFSLLELLLYMAILAMVSLFIASAFLSLNRGRGQVEARSEVNSNLRFGIEKISQDIRLASVVTTPGAAGASASNLIMTVGGQTIEYCVNAGQLRRQTVTVCGPSSDAITSTLVEVNTTDDPLTFTRLENTISTALNKRVVSIEIKMKIRHKSDSPDYQYSQQKRITVSSRVDIIVP